MRRPRVSLTALLGLGLTCLAACAEPQPAPRREEAAPPPARAAEPEQPRPRPTPQPPVRHEPLAQSSPAPRSEPRPLPPSQPARPARQPRQVQPQGKASLAVLPFTYHRTLRSSGRDLPETATFTNKFVTALVQTRKFDVVERQRLDSLLDEMALGESGLMDPQRAVQAGKMLGADYLLMGEVALWTVETSVSQIPMTKRWQRRRTMHLVVDMRIVDSRTGKITASRKGEVRDEQRQNVAAQVSETEPPTPAELDAVQRQVVESLVLQVIDVIYPVRVIGVNGATVSLNRGEGGGLTPGLQLDVFMEGEPLVDPDTGEVLGAEETKVGRVQVEQVLAKFTKATLVAGEAVVGDLCRPAEGPAEFAPPPIAAPPPPPADTRAPTVRILAPKEGATLNSDPVTVVAEVEDDHGVVRVTIQGAEATRDAQGRWRGQVRVADGGNRVTVSAWDAAGNEGRGAVTFTFDATPPQVDGEATLLVEGRVDDLECTLTINGQKVEYDRQTGNYRVRVQPDPQDPGRVTIVATDAFGNQTTQVRRVR